MSINGLWEESKRQVKRGYNRIRRNKEGRTLIANFGYLSVLQVASYVFPLITIPYLTRVIGVDNFGKIAFASAIMTWIITISDWGFNFTATRDLSRERDDKEKVSEIFSNVLWARCFLMMISFFLLWGSIFFIPTFRENQDIILISFLLVPGHIMFPQWFFQGMERMKYITILNLASKLIFTLCIFIFIKEESDFLLQPLFTSLGFVAAGLIAMYIILVKWRVRLKPPVPKLIISTITKNTDVFLNNLMPNLYNSFSIMLLGFFGGPVANGILDAGNKFMTVAQQFMSVMSRAFYPFLSRRIDKHSSYTRINIGIAVLFATILFMAAPLFIKAFFTEDFYDAIIVLRILSFSIIFLSFGNIFGTNYMIIQGYEKELRNITFASSLIGLVISIPLVFYFSFIGAAATITLSRGLLGISIMWKAINIKRGQ